MKKVVSILLVLLMLLSTSAVGTISASAASNIVIAGVDIGYANGDYFTKNGKSCANSYWASGRCHHNYVCDETTHSQCNCMRYWPTGKPSTCEVDLKASQCFGFARYCQWIVYGYHDKSSASKFTDLTGTITSCTGSKLKTKLINCAPGTHVRTLETKKGWGHSIVIISTSDYGVNIADANSDGYCKVRYATYSWDQLATWVNEYGGIDYANSSKSITHVHDYVAEGYEQAHPHKVFRKCACGDWYYTGATKTLDTCLTCNPTTLKVYFNANGGSISSDTYKLSSNLIYNKSDSSKYYQKWTYNNTKENGLVNASTFGIYKTGYTFNGWGTKASGGTVFDQGDNTLKPTDINANIKNGDCSTTLYAQWKANVLTINYNANGGSINSEKYKLSSNVLYYISNNSKVNDLWEYNNAHENGLYNPGTFGIYKTGYSFNGWGTKSNGGTIFDQNDASLKPTSINSNIKTGNCSTTLYAQWVANGYKIAFNGNGATSGSMSNLSMTYGTAKNLTANSFVKTGCTFNGWNTKADGSGTAYANKVSVKNLTSAKGGTITLYAQWKANSYTIAFNGNGATSGSMSNLAMTYGTAKNLTANAFSKTGYTFNGWNTKADDSGTAYANKVSVKNLTSAKGGTITLYAQWKANSYTIAFNGNGATSGSMSNLAMTYGTAKNLTANAFSKTGYTFNGWNTKADGSGTAYANKVSVKNLTSAKGGTVTLYAQWKANPVTSYTVSYNANGGSVSPSSASVTAGNSVTLPTPTKSYTITYNVNGGNNAPSSQSVSVGCKGWTTSSSSSSAAYSCGASYKPTANVTLYAVWNSSANKTLSTTTPTRNGYTFLGWSTSSSATSSTWKKGETITLMGNTTLYAVWQKIETPVPTPDPVPEVVYKTVALNYKDVYQINIDEFDAVEFVAEDDSVLTVDSDGTVRTHSTGSADVYVYDSNSDVRMVYTFEVDYAWWQWIIIIVLFGWIWY